MKKRLLASFLTIVMLLGMLPTSVFAAEADGDNPLAPATKYYTFEGKDATENDYGIALSKTAEYIGDGKYKIELTADAKQIVMPKATEVVFVLDASSSMNACTNTNCAHDPQTGSGCTTTNNSGYSHQGKDNAVEAFKHPESRWVIATKAIDDMKEVLGNEGISYKYVAFGTNAAVYESYDDVKHNGVNYTYLKKGVELGLKQFSNNDTNKVLIIVSDGAATDGYDPNGLDEFDGKVYAVGFTYTNSAFEKMADKYFTASNAGELTVAMDKIAENIVGLITDPMGNDVDLDGKVTVTEGKPDAVITGSTINWTDSKGLDGKVVLTYEVEIKPAKQTAGSLKIELNGAAKLNYSYTKNDQTHESFAEFPIPVAVIEAATLDVVYKLNGKRIDSTSEWINLTEDETFETQIPEVGNQIKIKGQNYWVVAVEGEVPSETEAQAYNVTVTLSDEKPITEYNVTYSVTGDSPAGYTAPGGSKHAVGSNVTVEAVPTAPGYDFDGWKLNNNIVTSFEMPETDVELTGKWTANAASVTWTVDGTVKSTQNGKTGDAVTEYNFTPSEGYSFDGWYTDAECTTKATIAQTMLGEIVYYGKTAPETDTKYKVEHYLQKLDGTGYELEDTENLTGTTASSVTATAKTYTGFTFDNTIEGTVQSGNIAGDGSLVLKLFYTRNNYTVTFVDEDGTVLKEATEYAYGTPAARIAQPETPTKRDDAQYSFQFAGWNPVVADVTEDVVYWATYRPDGDQKQYTFTFDANGGEWKKDVSGYEMTGTTKASKVYTYLDVAKEIEAPVREGYEFVGWYLTSGGTSKVWFVSYEGTPVQPMIIEDTTVYAKWAKVYQEPTEEDKVGTLWVNLQDENGTWLGGTDTGIAVTEDYLVAAEAGEGVDYVIPATVTVGTDKYIYETVASGKLSDTVKTKGENFVVCLQYTKDNLNAEEDELTGGDGIPDKYQVTINYESNDTTMGTVSNATEVLTITDSEGNWIAQGDVTIGGSSATANAGYSFVKWTNDAGVAAITTANVGTPTIVNAEGGKTYTFTAEFAHLWTVTFDSNGGTDVDSKVVLDGMTVTEPDAPTRNKYRFTGWYLDGKKYDFTTPVTGDITLIADWNYIGSSDDDDRTPSKPATNSKVKGLNTKDHIAYVFGYPDGTVRPEGDITRAEMAAIFVNLMTEEYLEEYYSVRNPYLDVPSDAWYNPFVSTMYEAGAIKDSEDYFRPNEPITRAELAVMAAQFATSKTAKASTFSDVSKKHWAADEIALVQKMGWISGYPDGTYRPDNNITRAEAMSIINHMLERSVEEKHMLKGMIKWIDNPSSAWYYEIVQEATNGHTYKRTSDKVGGNDYYYERWIKLTND